LCDLLVVCSACRRCGHRRAKYGKQTTEGHKRVTVRLESLSIFHSLKAVRRFTLAGYSATEGATSVATSR
jgi:hypothetical protein